MVKAALAICGDLSDYIIEVYSSAYAKILQTRMVHYTIQQYTNGIHREQIVDTLMD